MVGGNHLFPKVGRYLFSSKGFTFSHCWTPAPRLEVQLRFNSNRASICRVNRLQYLRPYPTVVVNPDGSTYTIRYHEPRQIIKLPVDINTCSLEEQQKHLDRRRPKTKVNLDDEYEDVAFDSSKYLKLVRK